MSPSSSSRLIAEGVQVSLVAHRCLLDRGAACRESLVGLRGTWRGWRGACVRGLRAVRRRVAPRLGCSLRGSGVRPVEPRHRQTSPDRLSRATASCPATRHRRPRATVACSPAAGHAATRPRRAPRAAADPSASAARAWHHQRPVRLGVARHLRPTGTPSAWHAPARRALRAPRTRPAADGPASGGGRPAASSRPVVVLQVAQVVADLAVGPTGRARPALGPVLALGLLRADRAAAPRSRACRPRARCPSRRPCGRGAP